MPISRHIKRVSNGYTVEMFFHSFDKCLRGHKEEILLLLFAEASGYLCMNRI